jgi:hypothetical protein
MASVIQVDTIQTSLGTSAITFDSLGRVLHPNVPAFMAVNTTGYTVNGLQKITTWSVSANIACFNNGGNFDTGNQRFTAPVAGRYMFSAMMMPSADSNAKNMYYYKNGSNIGNYILPYLSGGTTRATINAICVFNLAVGDYIEVYLNTNASSTYDNSGYFCGYLIG